MGIKLANIWEYLRSSFWFIPVIMSMVAIGAAMGMLHADEIFKRDHKVLQSLWFYTGGSENARQILSTIASSMIQVAGVVFSITIVALSLSSSQFGPRLLRTFMKDVRTQMVLGSFVATYIYCLVVLRNVITGDEDDFIPNLSIAFAIILTIINILVLIYFIHHVSTSIQADKVIQRVYHELNSGVKELFPEEFGKGEARSRPTEFSPGTHVRVTIVKHANSGYVQALDNDELWKLAVAGDLFLEVHLRPGQYVVKGLPMVTVHSRHPLPDGIADKIRGSAILGYQRTPEQDAEFSIDQLVEVALRALSPSLNDPFTAMSCIDRLCSILSELSSRQFPSPYRYEQDDTLRMITDHPVTFDELFQGAFGRIRQSAGGNAPVLLRLLWAMDILHRQAHTKHQRAVIMQETGLIREVCQDTIPQAADRARMLAIGPDVE